MMTHEIRKFVLYGVLALIALGLYNAWTKEHATPVNAVPTHKVAQKTIGSPNAANAAASTKTTSFTPSAFTPTKALHSQAVTNANTAPSAVKNSVTITTDTFAANINMATGDISQIGLVTYPISVKQPNVPIKLFNSDANYFYSLPSPSQFQLF